MGEHHRQPADPGDRETDRGGAPQASQVLAGPVQQTLARPEPAREQGDWDGQSKHVVAGDEAPLGQARRDGSRPGRDVVGVRRPRDDHPASLLGEPPRQVAGDHHERGEDAQQPHEDAADDADGPGAAQHEERGERQAEQAVRAEDVAVEQQRGVQQAEHEQGGVPAREHAGDGAAGGAARGARPVELHHAVAEQQREQGQRPHVDGHDRGALHDPVEALRAERVGDRGPVPAPPEEPRDVRQHDEQQHHPAGEVRGQGAARRPGTARRGRHGAARASSSPARLARAARSHQEWAAAVTYSRGRPSRARSTADRPAAKRASSTCRCSARTPSA